MLRKTTFFFTLSLLCLANLAHAVDDQVWYFDGPGIPDDDHEREYKLQERAKLQLFLPEAQWKLLGSFTLFAEEKGATLEDVRKRLFRASPGLAAVAHQHLPDRINFRSLDDLKLPQLEVFLCLHIGQQMPRGQRKWNAFSSDIDYAKDFTPRQYEFLKAFNERVAKYPTEKALAVLGHFCMLTPYQMNAVFVLMDDKNMDPADAMLNISRIGDHWQIEAFITKTPAVSDDSGLNKKQDYFTDGLWARFLNLGFPLKPNRIKDAGPETGLLASMIAKISKSGPHRSFWLVEGMTNEEARNARRELAKLQHELSFEEVKAFVTGFKNPDIPNDLRWSYPKDWAKDLFADFG